MTHTVNFLDLLPDDGHLTAHQGTAFNHHNLADHVQQKALQNTTHLRVLLNFQGIENLTVTTAKKWGPELLQHLLNAHPMHSQVAAIHCTPSVTYALQTVFALPEAPAALMVWQDNHSWQVVGTLPPAITEVLLWIHRGAKTASDLEHLGVRAPSRKLHRLMQLCPWTLQKNWVPCPQGGAWQYHYCPWWLPEDTQASKGFPLDLDPQAR